VSADEELEDEDGELGVVALPDVEPEADPEAAPEGVLGVVVVEPEDEDAPEPGVVVREVARSPLSQPVSIPAPSATDTAKARIESLMLWASVVGVRLTEQGSGPTR
jgi:hypothetical protein